MHIINKVSLNCRRAKIQPQLRPVSNKTAKEFRNNYEFDLQDHFSSFVQLKTQKLDFEGSRNSLHCTHTLTQYQLIRVSSYRSCASKVIKAAQSAAHLPGPAPPKTPPKPHHSRATLSRRPRHLGHFMKPWNPPSNPYVSLHTNNMHTNAHTRTDLPHVQSELPLSFTFWGSVNKNISVCLVWL